MTTKYSISIKTGHQYTYKTDSNSFEWPEIYDKDERKFLHTIAKTIGSYVKAQIGTSITADISYRADQDAREIYLNLTFSISPDESNQELFSNKAEDIGLAIDKLLSGDLKMVMDKILSNTPNNPEKVRLTTKQVKVKGNGLVQCPNDLVMSVIQSLRKIRFKAKFYLIYSYLDSKYSLELGDVCKRSESTDSKKQHIKGGRIVAVSDNHQIFTLACDGGKKYFTTAFNADNETLRKEIIAYYEARDEVKIRVRPSIKYRAGIAEEGSCSFIEFIEHS